MDYLKCLPYTAIGFTLAILLVIVIALSWCVSRHRRHLITAERRNSVQKSPGSFSAGKPSHSLNNAGTQPNHSQEEPGVDPSCCCPYYIVPSGDDPSPMYESCSNALNEASTGSPPESLNVCPAHHLMSGCASLPAKPRIPPIETQPFRIQPSPLPPRRAVEFGQQRANIIESSCSVGDLQEASRGTAPQDSSNVMGYNEERGKGNHRSLLELRRGPHAAALMLNLNSAASNGPSCSVINAVPDVTPVEDSRLLFTEQPPTSYSTFDLNCPISSIGATATASSVHPQIRISNLSPRPKTGEEPSKVADRVTLTMASLPLSGEELEVKLGSGGEDRLYKEFWDIPMNFANKADCPWIGVGQKNRYREVLPHNSTRVVLPAINNDEMTSYINANFIHGYQGRPGAFIATQGPMSHTVNDFWRMIWHTHAPAVVMLTKICEQDKRSKCELYLPTLTQSSCGRTLISAVRADTVPDPSRPPLSQTRSPGPPILQSATSLPPPAVFDPTAEVAGEEFSRVCSPVGAQRTFGNIQVRVIAVTQKEGYTERKLLLRMDGEERRVTHFWYIGWSDHSSPEATIEAALSLLQLVQDAEACRSENCGSSLPSTPASLLHATTSAIKKTPQSPRSLSRQVAEEWSDIDFDQRFVEANGNLPTTTTTTTTTTTNTVFDLSCLAESDFQSADHGFTSGPRSSRASDPAPSLASTPATEPLVVHCSAGVGRTGCFIALCIGCLQLCNEGKVDVLGVVSRMRLDRGGMVENSEQYAFLHAALCVFNATRKGRKIPEMPAIKNFRNQFTGPLR